MTLAMMNKVSGVGNISNRRLNQHEIKNQLNTHTMGCKQTSSGAVAIVKTISELSFTGNVYKQIHLLHKGSKKKVFKAVQSLLIHVNKNDLVNNLKDLLDKNKNNKELWLELLLGATIDEIFNIKKGSLDYNGEQKRIEAVALLPYGPKKSESIGKLLDKGEVDSVYLLLQDSNRHLFERIPFEPYSDKKDNSWVLYDRLLYPSCEQHDRLVEIYKIFDNMRGKYQCWDEKSHFAEFGAENENVKMGILTELLLNRRNDAYVPENISKGLEFISSDNRTKIEATLKIASLLK